jgi:NADPH:quinone reductase-like Zn-dependent oxidoreductase
MRPDSDQLTKIASFYESKDIKVYIDKVFKIEDYKSAFEYVESGRAVGKVVLKIFDKDENVEEKSN